MAWVFTGDEYFEGMDRIADILSDKVVKGSFFLTGRLYRNPGARGGILRLKGEGHYLGPHSDQHLLYNDWTRRDSVLVTRDSMRRDLLANYEAMETLGIRQRRRYFIPPYEWWDDTVAAWCREMGVQVVNFTPGTGTNADYTFPEMGATYRSSDTLVQLLLRFEARAAAAPAGTTRTWVVEVDGWCKDMDPLTRHGATIGPLPARGAPSPEARELHGRWNDRLDGGR